MSSDEGDITVSDTTLLSIVKYIGVPIRDALGNITGVDYNRNDSNIALHELGKLLQEEESKIRSYEREESRVEEPRSVFVRVSSWRIPSKILIPMFLFLDLSEIALLGKIIYLFIALLIPPPKHTANLALNHKLIAETRLLFSSFGIQNKLRQLLVSILKNRNSRRLNGDEVRVLTGFLELIVSLMRLPDDRLPSGAPTRTTDVIVSTMSEVRILELLPQIIQQNDFYLNGSSESHPSFSFRSQDQLPVSHSPVEAEQQPAAAAPLNESVGYTQLIPQDTQLEILPETLVSQIEEEVIPDEENKKMPAPTFRLNQQVGEQDAQVENTQLTMMDTQLPNILDSLPDSVPPNQQPVEEIETEGSSDEEEEDSDSDDEVRRKRRGGKAVVSNELKRAKLTEAAAERILEGMDPDLDGEEVAQLQRIQQAGPAEVENDIIYWNQLVIEIINYLYRRQDMAMLTSASQETVNQTCSHTLSQALTDSLNNEKRTRAMQHPKLNGSLGKQGFFTRNNKIVRAEVLTRGGIVDARDRVTKNRLHREEDSSKYTIRVQGILGRFLMGFLDAAGMVLLQHSIPKVLNKINRQDDFESSYSDEQIDFSIKFYSFSRILLGYCRAMAVATKSLIDLSEVSAVLQEEVFFRAFDLSLSMVQQQVTTGGEGTNNTMSRDVLNQKKQSHHVCISFLKEGFAVLSSLMETYKPQNPADVPDDRFTATKALAASVLHRRDNIRMIIRFLKEHEVYKYPFSYRVDLIQLAHVVLMSLAFISRGGKIYVQRKSRKKVKKAKKAKSEAINLEDEANEMQSEPVSDSDHSEASSSVYSEWTDDDEIGMPNEEKENRKAWRAFRAEWNRATRYGIHSDRDPEVFVENLQLKDKRGLAILFQAASASAPEPQPSQESDASSNEGGRPIDTLYYATLKPGEICPPDLLREIKRATKQGDNNSDASEKVNRYLEQDAESTDDSEESVATVYEDTEMDLKGILYEFVQPRVIQTYIDSLREWKINSMETNGCICHFLMRVAFELKLSPCVLSVECLTVYEEILQSIQVMSSDESLRHLVQMKYQLIKDTCERLVRKWIALYKKHDYWGVLSLGWVTRYEADIIQDGSLFSTEVQRHVEPKPERGNEDFQFDNISGDEELGEAAHFDPDVDPEIRARAAAWRKKRWGPEDDLRLKQVWEQFLLEHKDGFVGEIKAKIFKEKNFSAKAILEKAVSIGLVVPPDVTALPAPKAKWTKELEETLKDNFPHYCLNHPQGDECLTKLREDIIPMFSEDQILRKAKTLGIEEATTIQQARKKATAARAAAARRKKREEELEEHELTKLLQQHEENADGDDEDEEVVRSRKSRKSKKEKKKKEKKPKKEKKKNKREGENSSETDFKKRSRVADEDEDDDDE